MDFELIDLTLDDDEEEEDGYMDETSSIYSLATLPTKREAEEMTELDEIEEEREEVPEQPHDEEEDAEERLQQSIREEEEMQIARAVMERLEWEQEAVEAFEREREEEAMAQAAASALNDDLDDAAASPIHSSFVRRLFDDAADEADVGVSGDIPWSEQERGEATTRMLCDDGTVTVKRIPADGHCLYRAVLHQRLPPDRRDQIPDDDAVAELRREVAGFMRKNRSTLQHFYTAEKRQDLDHSIDLVEDGGWGDHISLYAVANLWSSPIEVLMEYGPKMVHYPDGQDTIGTSPSAPPPTLRLAYRCAPDADGQMVYIHYDSVVEVDGQQPAASAPSTAAPPPSTAAPSATPPRSACSTPSRGSRAPRRPHSPPATRSPRKRLCPAATETSATSGPSQSSQELVDPPSPTPGVLAPGSPNADCMSASQPSQPSQDTDAQVAVDEQVAADDDDAQATINERVATEDHGAQTSVSERVVEDLAAQVYEDEDDAQGTVVDDMEGLVTTAFSPVRPISPVSFGGKSAPRNRLLSPEASSGFLTLVPELTSAQRASEWVWSQTLSDVPVDDDEANDIPPVDERLDPNRQDAATGVSTIFGILTDWQYQSVAATQPSKEDTRSLHPVAKTRTVSTNVVLSSGTLVGTFQVFDS